MKRPKRKKAFNSQSQMITNKMTRKSIIKDTLSLRRAELPSPHVAPGNLGLMAKNPLLPQLRATSRALMELLVGLALPRISQISLRESV